VQDDKSSTETIIEPTPEPVNLTFTKNVVSKNTPVAKEVLETPNTVVASTSIKIPNERKTGIFESSDDEDIFASGAQKPKLLGNDRQEPRSNVEPVKNVTKSSTLFGDSDDDDEDLFKIPASSKVSVTSTKTQVKVE